MNIPHMEHMGMLTQLTGCSAQWMETLLKSRAVEVLFSGVERTERLDDGQAHCGWMF